MRFKMNPFGFMGGVVALISLALPWVFSRPSRFSFDLFLYLTALQPSSAMNDNQLLAIAIVSIVLVLLGGIGSILDPRAGAFPIVGGVLFAITLPGVTQVVASDLILAPALGVYVAVAGGLFAIAGVFIRKFDREIIIGGESRTSASTLSPKADVEMACPTCGITYPASLGRYCPNDGAELRPLT